MNVPQSAEQRAYRKKRGRRSDWQRHAASIQNMAKKLRGASKRLHALGFPCRDDAFLEMARRCDELAADAWETANGKEKNRPVKVAL